MIGFHDHDRKTASESKQTATGVQIDTKWRETLSVEIAGNFWKTTRALWSTVSKCSLYSQTKTVSQVKVTSHRIIINDGIIQQKIVTPVDRNVNKNPTVRKVALFLYSSFKLEKILLFMRHWKFLFRLIACSACDIQLGLHPNGGK